MEFSTYLLLLCACVVKQVSTSINVADVMCGRSQVRQGKIKNGVDAYPGEYPWMVSIRTSGPSGAHYCGGSLIHKRFVLTAAHCIHRTPAKYVAVVAGLHSVHTKDSENIQILSVSNKIIASNFSKKYINDIALLELTQDAQWTKFVRPICLPDLQLANATDTLSGQFVTVAGWGYTDEAAKGGKPATVLQKVDVEVIPRATCQEWYNKEVGKLVPFYDSHLCAGHEFGEKDACQGDSGGPLMTSDESGRQVVIGVVSAGYGCGRRRTPGIYTKVSRYIEWINETIRNASVARQ